MKKIQTVEELSFEAQSRINGGTSSCSCSCTCSCSSCSCNENQNKSSIDSNVSSTTNSVASGVRQNLSSN